ncbi:Txe/YoeB family addiction module toxin [Staphylococcus equorum]|uniref:Endoribonuclease YoeB n=1 Tax=Staphylococcus equorum TaxID=246432 RepID=A0A9X4L437_9STAP|nr:Txe/YoeB family addiction module toxin [Staphylococcus equorum]MDG0819709.1 Txe/YoeB family addiction module toxin [Staphylococcus equorum]MDG0840350.1 Txe/YoeB family addiction module toxin [Staphylococcus equorum]MDG0846033.1 Txe/YoeB family addiction module toxin [Staphylococcus equorum]
MAKLNITFSPEGFEDYEYFQSKDRQMVKRINKLLKSISRDGALDGIGKPEKLVGNLSGYYSRRVNQEHRLVYTVDDDAILVVSCRYHYK